jgi:antitoxin ParD1/3/4
MPTRNVNLSEKQAEFIRDRVTGGDYGNASEVVRAALRLLEQREQEDKLKLRALRRMAKESFAEIDHGKFDVIDHRDLGKFMKKVGAKVRAGKP